MEHCSDIELFSQKRLRSGVITRVQEIFAYTVQMVFSAWT